MCELLIIATKPSICRHIGGCESHIDQANPTSDQRANSKMFAGHKCSRDIKCTVLVRIRDFSRRTMRKYQNASKLVIIELHVVKKSLRLSSGLNPLAVECPVSCLDGRLVTLETFSLYYVLLLWPCMPQSVEPNL
jgi:hypothetical protein